ncbi:MAG: cell wall hydrolase [Lachnospira sp.]|nr:cell wall hydrolase [Lachnospira sp.]
MKIRFRLLTRNFITAFLALCICVSFAVTVYIKPVTLIADTQDDYDALNAELKELREKQKQLDTQFNELNTRISESGEKLAALEIDINNKQAEIDASNTEISNMEADIAKQYDAMKLRIKYMYENDESTVLSSLLSAKSLSDLLAKSEYVQQLTNYDKRKMEELNNLMVSLKDTRSKLESEMTELVSLKENASRESANFSNLLYQCQSQIDSNSQRIEDAEALALQYEKKLEQEMLEKQRKEMESMQQNSPAIDEGLLNQVLTNYTAQDLAMLAAIIECEAGNQSYEGKCAVGSVVINRVADPRFANSISGVIYAPYQFSPVASGRFAIVLARGAKEDCMQAAIDVLNGYININALYFHAYNSAVDKGGTVIGDHVFY